MICIFGNRQHTNDIYSVRGHMGGQLHTYKVKQVPGHFIGVLHELGSAVRNFYRLYLRIVSYRTIFLTHLTAPWEEI